MNDIVYELKNGNGKVKEYNYNGKLFFEDEYLSGEKMEKEKYIIIIVYYFLKVNI